MREIPWQEKFTLVLTLADAIFKAGNNNLDLADRKLYSVVPFVGSELDEKLGWHSDDDNRSKVLYRWLRHGFTLEHFESWSPSQLMAAYAAYLVSDAEEVLDDLPEPDRTIYMWGLSWRRDQIIEHCACNIIYALEACHFGNILINETIQHDPEKLRELLKKHDSDRGKRAAQKKLDHDPRQADKKFVYECWQEWQDNRNRYKSKADFARDMLSKCQHLKSTKKIEDWCREWEKAEKRNANSAS